MEIIEFSTLFYTCILLGTISGFTGGWMMQPIAAKVDKDQFNIGSLFMLFGDVGVLAAVLVLYGASFIHFLSFFAVMFCVPAIGFLMSKYLRQESQESMSI